MFRVKLYDTSTRKFMYLRVFIGLQEALDYADDLAQEGIPGMILGIFDHEDSMMYSIRFDESTLRTIERKGIPERDNMVGD